MTDPFPELTDLGCHEAEVGRDLLPAEQKPWEMVRPWMHTITAARRASLNEGPRRRRRSQP